MGCCRQLMSIACRGLSYHQIRAQGLNRQLTTHLTSARITTLTRLWSRLLRPQAVAGDEHHATAGPHASTPGPLLAQAERLLQQQLHVFEGRVEGGLLPEQVHQELMAFYRSLSPGPPRHSFLLLLTQQLGLKVEVVTGAAQTWLSLSQHHQQQPGPEVLMRAASRLQAASQPLYCQLWEPLSRERDGITFLVHMRADVREALAKVSGPQATALRALDAHLRRALSALFTPGLLSCERISWQHSSGQVLEKVAHHEAVHPVAGWSDLRRRLASDRRVQAFFHPCLPGEPLVILHVALTHHVTSCMAELLPTQPQPVFAVPPALASPGMGPGTSASHSSTHPLRMPLDEPTILADQSLVPSRAANWEAGSDWDGLGAQVPAATAPTVAVFYSISNTQPGLAGIDLGHSLILDVSQRIKAELPAVQQLVTLSPLPGFRDWLLTRLAALALQPQQPPSAASHLASSNINSTPVETTEGQQSRGQDQQPNEEGQQQPLVHVRPLPTAALDSHPLFTPSEADQISRIALCLLSDQARAHLTAAQGHPAVALALLLEQGTWVGEAGAHTERNFSEIDGNEGDVNHCSSSTSGETSAVPVARQLEILLKTVLMRTAARYLVLERRRSMALDPVAHFHLRNGACLWRTNWRSDMSTEGLRRSLGIMVNYSYDLTPHLLQANNRAYLVEKEIRILPQVAAWLPLPLIK
mmetsp:Transcript_8863/g.15352  ORF Transcript_8863/g.15352 Transcript_8863/m.15352 type:complete len:699 (-) Transcript_8863:72-2168(-)